MNGKRVAIGLVLMVFLAAVVGMVIAADKNKVYYVCNCKDDCACNTVSREPGKCKCGNELTQMHLLAIEKDTAILCRCGAECTCERTKDNPDKCGCGKLVKKVSLKGKYICGCSDNCNCGTISDKPGKCSCGKEMKQVI
jgi:hypothetical protein